MNPNQRTLRRLRAAGYLVAVVEKWNAHAEIRQDLFGIFDVVAIRADKPGVLGVQVSSLGGLSARVKKLKESDVLPVWLAAGNRAVVHGWEQVAGKWVCRIREL